MSSQPTQGDEKKDVFRGCFTPPFTAETHCPGAGVVDCNGIRVTRQSTGWHLHECGVPAHENEDVGAAILQWIAAAMNEKAERDLTNEQNETGV